MNCNKSWSSSPCPVLVAALHSLPLAHINVIHLSTDAIPAAHMYIPAYTHLHQSLHLMLHIIPWKLQPESAQKAWPRFHLQDATCMCVEPLKHVCRRKAVAHVVSGLDRGQVCHHGGTWAGACQCVAKPHAEGHNAQAGDGCLQMEWVSGKQTADELWFCTLFLVIGFGRTINRWLGSFV